MSDLYDNFVPTIIQIVEAQIGLIEKAEALCAAKSIAPADLLEERLTQDMLPLKFQFMQVSRHSAGALAHFTGAPAPAAGGDTLAAIRQSLTDALAYLKAVNPADLAGAESKPVVLEMRSGAMKFAGRDYLSGFALPNLMFHASIAYAILRKAGADIGKRDFLGKIRTAD